MPAFEPAIKRALHVNIVKDQDSGVSVICMFGNIFDH
jgi:hypothetical protein